MILYAVLCGASIEPRPEDGDPRDGDRMHQASNCRAGRCDSIKFKLQAINHLNKQISNTRLTDDYLPILHTIAILLRIEVSPAARNPHHERFGVRSQANWCFPQTMHGNVQLVRAHLSGVRQLIAYRVRFAIYPYSSMAPIIQSVRHKLSWIAVNANLPGRFILRVQWIVSRLHSHRQLSVKGKLHNVYATSLGNVLTQSSTSLLVAFIHVL